MEILEVPEGRELRQATEAPECAEEVPRRRADDGAASSLRNREAEAAGPRRSPPQAPARSHAIGSQPAAAMSRALVPELTRAKLSEQMALMGF